MWRPRGMGMMAGWLTLFTIAVYFLRDDMSRIGLFSQSCAQYGLNSWSCGVLPKMVVGLADTFVYFITHPFKYDSRTDLIGVDYATMWMGSPVSYAVAVVAANYWIWKLNSR